MANVFDQFDYGSSNPFDKFDAPSTPNYDKRAFDDGPLKIGKEGFADALRETLKEAGWAKRNIAGAGAAVVNAYEGIKGVIPGMKSDEDQVANQKIIAQEAPVGNLAGGVAMLAPTALIPGANTVTGSATIGAVANMLTTPGDIKERGKAAILGGVGGAAGAKLSSLVSRVPKSVVNPDVQLLSREGITLTPGQNAGGTLKALEDKATSWPIVGDVINSARKRGITEFNAAAINRAKLPGMEVDGVGNQAMQDLRQGLGQAYDEVLAKSNVNALEPEFVQKISNLREMAKSLPEREQKAFDSIIEREIGQRMSPNGMVNAENLQAAKSGLGNEANNFATSTDAYQRQLGQALKQSQQEFIDLVSRSNPQNAAELKAIDTAYANFKRLQKASSGVGAEGGVFTPAQLQSAVKAADRTKDKRAFSEGTALMQDLAAAGKAVMPSKVPDSGTAGRTFSNITTPSGLISTLLGAGAALPVAAAYSKVGSKAINKIVNSSPAIKNKLMQLIADNPDLLRNFGTSIPKLVSD